MISGTSKFSKEPRLERKKRYRDLFRAMVRRNLQSETPRTGTVLVLQEWRNLRRDVTREANRQFALRYVSEEMGVRHSAVPGSHDLIH